MWRVAGENLSKRPVRWLGQDHTRELIAALKVRGAYLYDLVTTKRGRRGGGTYAHPVLALAYAEYLEPALGVEVREIALRVYAGDVTVLDDFKRSYAEQLEEDANRLMTREEVRRNNADLNQLLKEQGATFGRQWASFHNEGYLGLYNETEDQIHTRKGLKRGEKILDHMAFVELAPNLYRTAIAQQYLREYPGIGVPRAIKVHHRMGKSVREHLISLGLKTPEQQPNVDSIKAAEKRLKAREPRRLRLRGGASKARPPQQEQEW